MPLDDNRMGPSANYAGYWLLSSQATKPNPNPTTHVTELVKTNMAACLYTKKTNKVYIYLCPSKSRYIAKGLPITARSIDNISIYYTTSRFRVFAFSSANKNDQNETKYESVLHSSGTGLTDFYQLTVSPKVCVFFVETEQAI